MSENSKPMPFFSKKGLLKKMYNNVSSRVMDDLMFSIIQKSLAKNKTQRTLRCSIVNHLELVEIVAELGTPKGYELTPEFEKSLRDFKFQQDSLKQISIKIEQCALEIRKAKINKTTLQNVDKKQEKELQLTQICFKHNLSVHSMVQILGLKSNKQDV
jgi:nitrogen-specific signal transduction histidine kinase